MQFIKQLAKRIFQVEARLILKKYKPNIIAITGSVGKTSTRDAIYLVLSKKFFVRKSEKSFTTELGIPLTIIGCTTGTGSVWQWCKNMFVGFELLFKRAHYPDWLILEIDGDKPGDFAGLSEWFHPNILVVTAIGDTPAHVEPFGSVERLLAEKKILLDTVAREGVIVYNADDTRASQLVEQSVLKKISCGTTHNCAVHADEFTLLYGNASGRQIPTGMIFEIVEGDAKNTVTIFNSIGVHNEYACLMAYAVAHELGVETAQVVASLNQYKSLPGRMNIIAGMKDTVVVDDSYNASPVAMQESLETFLRLETTGRKIAVLGDMLELGKYSVDEHKKIAPMLTGMSHVITVGIRSRGMVEELLSLGFNESHVLSCDTAEEAGGELQKILAEGDTVFVKGSQVMRMERVVLEVMRHPEDARTLLVRQEPEWLSRQ